MGFQEVQEVGSSAEHGLGLLQKLHATGFLEAPNPSGDDCRMAAFDLGDAAL